MSIYFKMIVVCLVRVAWKPCPICTALRKDSLLDNGVGDQTRCDDCHCLEGTAQEMRKKKVYGIQKVLYFKIVLY